MPSPSTSPATGSLPRTIQPFPSQGGVVLPGSALSDSHSHLLPSEWRWHPLAASTVSEAPFLSSPSMIYTRVGVIFLKHPLYHNPPVLENSVTTHCIEDGLICSAWHSQPRVIWIPPPPPIYSSQYFKEIALLASRRTSTWVTWAFATGCFPVRMLPPRMWECFPPAVDNFSLFWRSPYLTQ